MNGLLIATLPLWFFADFDGMPQLGGALFPDALRNGHVAEGRFGKGYAFVDSGKRAEDKFWRISDPAILDTFPRERGAFSCWFRSPEECLDLGQSPAFGFCGFWQFQWVWRGGSFNTGTAYGEQVSIKGFARSSDWRHFAAVWNDERLVLYLNGEKVAEKAKPQRIDMRTVPRRVLRIGAGYDGGPAANLVMDEIAIFSRDLSADEVKSLAVAKAPLVDHSGEVLLSRIVFPAYWRNQDDAALRTRVHVDADCTLAVKATVAGMALDMPARMFRKGSTRLAVPFNPSRLRVGKYPWELSLVDSDGRSVAGISGELDIYPRVERHRFKVMNWGGYKPLSTEFMHAIGVNSSNVGLNSPGGIRNLIANGISPNVRYEDIRRLPKGTQFDAAETMQRTDTDFAAMEGLHLWSETLVNSEVYGAGVGIATGNVSYVEFARRHIGAEPDFRYRTAPMEISPATYGGKAPQGIIRQGDCPQLDTIRWTLAKGHPYYLYARAAAKAIHNLQPDNVVWSEPMFEGLAAGLDMVADWQYQYSTEHVLRDILISYGMCRGYGRWYQPTLSPSYWGPQIFGLHPTEKGKDGKPLRLKMCQGADEVAIKAWISLSSVPVHALGLYETDMWEWGLKGESTNGRDRTYAEPDVVERYGRAWHRRLAPLADLFRDMPNAKSPIALVLLSECLYGSCIGWGQHHYPNQLGLALAEFGIPYDVVYGRELETAGLAGHRYAILPLSCALYEDHAKALDAAAKSGVKIITDKYATKTFDGGIHIQELNYPWTPREFPKLHETLQRNLRPMVDEMKKGLTAWSDCDWKSGYTFVKEYNGVRYVSVVNDLRSDDPGYLGQFVTNSWYRPMGAPQRIVTHFSLPRGSAVYEFNRMEAGGSEVAMKGEPGAGGLMRVSAGFDYPAADGKVFCIYPKRLKKLVARRNGNSIDVSLLDVDGGTAPGRQVVEVEVRDPSGAQHDETGRYVMEGGMLSVPLRFADDDPPRSSGSVWNVSVRELTTGFGATVALD